MALSKDPFCSIIIPVFNQLPYTKKCLSSLLERTAEPAFEIILVDNGSKDGTAAYLAKFAKKNQGVKVITFESNRGFAQASNEGARRASGEYLVFLNNDTMVTDSWLAEMIRCSGREKAGIVGSKLVYPEMEVINHAGYVRNGELKTFHLIYQLYPPLIPAVNKERDFQAVLGACMLIKRDLFQSLGQFNDIGLEDIDLCLKVRESGYRVLYCPKSVVYHYGSTTIEKSPLGSIPVKTPAEFNARWPLSKLLNDDTSYYAEDGYKIRKIENRTIFLEDLYTPSMMKVNEACRFRDAGNDAEARDKLLEAVNLHPHNCDALLELLSLALSVQDVGSALGWCEELVKRCPSFLEGYKSCVRLNLLLNKRSRAQEVLQVLKRQYDVPQNFKIELESYF